MDAGQQRQRRAETANADRFTRILGGGPMNWASVIQPRMNHPGSGGDSSSGHFGVEATGDAIHDSGSQTRSAKDSRSPSATGPR